MEAKMCGESTWRRMLKSISSDTSDYKGDEKRDGCAVKFRGEFYVL
jgi:hypothetical protein